MKVTATNSFLCVEDDQIQPLRVSPGRDLLLCAKASKSHIVHYLRWYVGGSSLGERSPRATFRTPHFDMEALTNPVGNPESWSVSAANHGKKNRSEDLTRIGRRMQIIRLAVADGWVGCISVPDCGYGDDAINSAGMSWDVQPQNNSNAGWSKLKRMGSRLLEIGRRQPYSRYHCVTLLVVFPSGVPIVNNNTSYLFFCFWAFLRYSRPRISSLAVSLNRLKLIVVSLQCFSYPTSQCQDFTSPIILSY